MHQQLPGIVHLAPFGIPVRIEPTLEPQLSPSNFKILSYDLRVV